MKLPDTLERFWGGIDVCLILLVLALLIVHAREMGRVRSGTEEPLRLREPVERTPRSELLPHVRREAVEGLAVSLGQSRFVHRSRARDEGEWGGLPASPAADMREEDGLYEISFALPERLDAGSVKASTSGNVLTVFINGRNQPGAAWVKRFYIPCGEERISSLETRVSNNVVRVRIRQRDGT